ncbi:glucosamine inositolphosphorylceramide transferase family protein [Psychrobacter aquimaris]|uniref:glucosamine inositolphosphorylceramide transferase family protein n=1 Tax=Psychrobacter aquimaris TaxID=292733 RepID=UPI003FD46E59
MKKTRLGILVEDETLAWYKFMPLKSLIDEGVVEVCIAVQQDKKQKSNISRLSKIIPSINQKIFSLLSRTKRNAKHYSIHDLATNGKMPVITSVPKQGKSTDEIEDSVIARLEAANLDYLINMGFRTLTGRILNVSKKGILLFHYGDETIQRGTPALYWQFAEKWENSVVTLQLLSNHLKVDKVVGRGYGTLFYWDYNLTADKLNGVAASILYWYFHKNKIGVESESLTNSIFDGAIYKVPQQLTAIRHLTSFFKNYTIKTFYKSLYRNKWSIFIGSLDQSMQTYTEILPEKGCFWADPFYIEQDSRRYIFFESLNYKEGIGRIEWVELDENHQVINVGPVDLGISSHLSFPNVFKHNNAIYMIPEAAKTNCINLLKATNFPQKWEKVHELVSGVQAADSAVIEHNGLWYLFTTHGSISVLTMDLELHIYTSDKLESDNWSIHPCAPLKIDVRGSRLAGALFKRDGQLFRTAQDGTIRYGRRVALYLVEELTPTSYKETFVRYIEPNWETDIDRLHTYNVYDQTVVLDVSRDKSRFTI